MRAGEREIHGASLWSGDESGRPKLQTQQVDEGESGTSRRPAADPRIERPRALQQATVLAAGRKAPGRERRSPHTRLGRRPGACGIIGLTTTLQPASACGSRHVTSNQVTSRPDKPRHLALDHVTQLCRVAHGTFLREGLPASPIQRVVARGSRTKWSVGGTFEITCGTSALESGRGQRSFPSGKPPKTTRMPRDARP